MTLPFHLQAEFVCRFDRNANQDSGVGRVRERNAHAATSTISTALSPMTWQPKILAVFPSKISCRS
jgi:hypothetical protein